MRVVVLGAGFGGLELATKLSEALDDGVDVAPAVALARDKMEVGSSRIQRWFGRERNCL